MGCTTRTAWCLVIVVMIGGVFGVSSAAGGAAADGVEQFSGMNVKQLKAYIKNKGTECVACSSKGDLIERALEIRDWPEASGDKEALEDEEIKKLFENLSMDSEKMAKLKESLAKAGIDSSKLGGNIMSAEDLDKVFKKENHGNDDAGKSGRESGQRHDGKDEL